MAYAAVADLNEHLNDSRADNEDLKQRALDAATAVIDSWTGRTFTVEEVPTARNFWNCGTLLLTDDFTSLTALYPEQSIGVLGELVDPTTYRPLPLNAAVHGEPYNSIEGVYGWGVFSVTATWGWPSVPAAITQACLLMAARIYKRRETTTGTLGFDEFALRLSSTDPDVESLLSPYRWVTVG